MMESLKSSRSRKLKDRLLSSPRKVCIERAKLITESYKETKGEPASIRRAKALDKILSNIPVNIWKDEIIVGNISSKKLGAGVYPETRSHWLEGELDSLEERNTDSFEIDSEDIELLRKEIFPYWKDKNIDYFTQQAWDEELINLHFSGQAFIITEFAGFGHIVLNHDRVINEGLASIVEKAENNLVECENEEKRNFYEASKIVCEAVIRFAERYGKEAERLSKIETDETRKKELEKIAKICRKVPAQSAETFHEALQAMYFVHLACQIEDYEASISIGRIDKLLHTFYDSDFEKGNISREEALTLLECFFLKLSSVVPLFSYFTTQYFGGLPVYTNVVVGGVDENNEDITNEVSHLAFEARKKSHIQPNFGVRVHEGTPPEFLEKVCESVVNGETNLYFYNDEATVPALTNMNISKEDALDYALNGCVEIAIPGKSFTSGDAGLINLAFALELALNQGEKDGKKLGVETKDPRKFENINELVESFEKQVNYLTSKFIDGINKMDEIHASVRPLPLISSLTENCIENGKDVTNGGAKYNSSGVQAVGIATVADSLAAINKLVFKEEKKSMDSLLEALYNNFEDNENLRQWLLNEVPKYGNDNDEVDKYVKKCVEIWNDAIKEYENYRGGDFWAGIYSATTHVAFGKLTSALPNGRKAGEPLSVGISPSQEITTSSPTSILKSASKIDYNFTPNGVALNLEFNPQSFGTLMRNSPHKRVTVSYFVD